MRSERRSQRRNRKGRNLMRHGRRGRVIRDDLLRACRRMHENTDSDEAA